MKCEGTLWFYCSDVPYLYFKIDSLMLFIKFTTVSYHKPIGNTIIFDEDDDDDKDEILIERYNHALPFCRSWVFHDPDSVLAIEYNCGKYSISYGQSRHTIMSMELSDDDAKYVATTMDEVFQQGQLDSYGDFKQEPDAIIDFGVGMCLKYKTSMWKYTRTDHPKEEGRFVIGEPVILPAGQKVKIVSNSSSFIV
jgi:hypothetical protein